MTIAVDLESDNFRDRLMKLRGGCRCCDPGASPPCSACCTEPSEHEIAEIREQLVDEDERDILDTTWLPDRESGRSYEVYLELRRLCGYDAEHAMSQSVLCGKPVTDESMLSMLNQYRKPLIEAREEAEKMGPLWGSW